MSICKLIGGSITAILTLIFAQVFSGAVSNVILNAGVPIAISSMINCILYLAPVFFALRLFGKKVLKLRPDELGMPGFSIKPIWVIVAIVLPFSIKGIYLLLVKGEFVSSNMNTSQIADVVCHAVFYYGIAAGFVEEMVFRGFIFHLMEKCWNRVIAIIVPSAIFGFVHILGTDHSLLSNILVICAGTGVGIMFSLIVINSGSVWNSGIVHALWNIIIIGGGLFISEKANNEAMITYVLKSKSFLITGGEFGIESSGIALAGYIVVSILILCTGEK
ncbi:MAG: CPBP family intramembrane metalloprotease [Lachnospiraceae bacterium]|nr:CPBP family intramembrane metalloprotease [Lachnospiraceae bacterium]